jgi:hypothetical protein
MVILTQQICRPTIELYAFGDQMQFATSHDYLCILAETIEYTSTSSVLNLAEG